MNLVTVRIKVQSQEMKNIYMSFFLVGTKNSWGTENKHNWRKPQSRQCTEGARSMQNSTEEELATPLFELEQLGTTISFQKKPAKAVPCGGSDVGVGRWQE